MRYGISGNSWDSPRLSRERTKSKKKETLFEVHGRDIPQSTTLDTPLCSTIRAASRTSIPFRRNKHTAPMQMAARSARTRRHGDTHGHRRNKNHTAPRCLPMTPWFCLQRSLVTTATRTHLDVAVDDMGAVHVLEPDEHLVQEQLDVVVRQELRRSDQLVQIGVDKLEHLHVNSAPKKVSSQRTERPRVWAENKAIRAKLKPIHTHFRFWVEEACE